LRSRAEADGPVLDIVVFLVFGLLLWPYGPCRVVADCNIGLVPTILDVNSHSAFAGRNHGSFVVSFGLVSSPAYFEVLET